jgi:ComEC/Rec2-related protein
MKDWLASFKFREFFNLSNYFLLLLVMITCFNLFLHFRINQNQVVQERNIEVLVLSSEREFFGAIYWLVWYQNSVWKLTDADFFYQTGTRYQILARLIPFKLNPDDAQSSFYLSTGLVGEIKVKERLTKSVNCDLFCGLLKIISDFRYQSKLKFSNLACNKYQKIGRLLAPGILCQDIAALSTGLTMGGTRDFQTETREAFRRNGLMHLVAISGLQVVLVVAFIEKLFLFLKTPKAYRIFLSLLFLTLLLALAGPKPPILRSGVSLIFSLTSLNILGRRLGTVRNLSYTAIVLLWLNPNYIFSFSFHMSFLATLGLKLARFNFNFKNFFVLQASKIFQQTLTAILFVLPLVINLTGFVSISSLFTNFLILPFISTITVLNFLTLVPILGDYLYLFVIFIQSQLLVLILDLSDKAILFKLSNFSFLEIFIYYLILICLVEFSRRWLEYRKLKLKQEYV